MTREEEVAQFLRSRKGWDYCDDCIANLVGINRHQARNATSGLGVSSDFNRADRNCSQCGKIKRVIHAKSN